jgi:hypothetical protein
MARATVEGNKVTIDEIAYEVRNAGTDRYSITDEFGRTIGNFELRARRIVPDDYGLRDAHPLVEIAKLWRDANDAALNAGPPPSKMICEMVTLLSADDAELAKERAHRAWLKTQSGVKAAFCTVDAANGKAIAIRVWSSAARREAILAKPPPSGSEAPEAQSAEVVALLDDL